MKRIQYNGTYAFRTDVGNVRTNNEDRATVLTNANGEVLLLVCDGMGGANKGDVASQLAIDNISKRFLERKPRGGRLAIRHWIISTVRHVNTLIYDRAEEDPLAKGMGTTMVLALLDREDLYLANLGDSRCYLDNGKEMRQISDDQTYVNYLVKCGQITPEEARSHPERHVLMNALGIFPSLSMTVARLPYAGERILCCTDGLYNQVGDSAIHAILCTDERADQKVTSLIAEANAHGGSDNIGVAYWEVLDRDD